MLERVGVEAKLARERLAELALLEVVPPLDVEMRQEQVHERDSDGRPGRRLELVEGEQGLEERENLRAVRRGRGRRLGQAAGDRDGLEARDLLQDRRDAGSGRGGAPESAQRAPL